MTPGSRMSLPILRDVDRVRELLVTSLPASSFILPRRSVTRRGKRWSKRTSSPSPGSSKRRAECAHGRGPSWFFRPCTASRPRAPSRSARMAPSRNTPYGVSKIIGEEIARSDPSWPSATVARVFNLIGPGLQDRHLPAVLARQFAAMAQGLGPALVEAGALTATRDFIDARDAAAAIVALAARGSPGDAYNVASGVEVSMSSSSRRSSRRPERMRNSLTGVMDARTSPGWWLTSLDWKPLACSVPGRLSGRSPRWRRTTTRTGPDPRAPSGWLPSSRRRDPAERKDRLRPPPGSRRMTSS